MKGVLCPIRFKIHGTIMLEGVRAPIY